MRSFCNLSNFVIQFVLSFYVIITLYYVCMYLYINITRNFTLSHVIEHFSLHKNYHCYFVNSFCFDYDLYKPTKTSAYTGGSKRDTLIIFLVFSTVK